MNHEVDEFRKGAQVKPRALICGVDGTLAHIGDRGPYEHEKAIDDRLDGPVLRLLYLYAEFGAYTIIIVTGRTAAHRAVTESWLRQHQVPYDYLFTRADGDNRKDSIVKRELYEQHIGPYYAVDFVLDDRNSVVEMWRKELGLDCFQVNDGDF